MPSAIRAKLVAAVLSDHGLHVSSPDDGDLDDVERARWDACVEIAGLFGKANRPLGELMSERWNAEAAAATPHAGEMLTYLRGLLADPSHPGIRRCAQKLIDEIEESACAGTPPAGRGDA